MKSASPTNHDPRLLKEILNERKLSDDLLVVLDIGARGGIEDQWLIFGDQVKILAFEPDKNECSKLNKLYKGKNATFFPYALSNKNERRKFYLTSYKDSAGFYKPDLKFWKRFPDEVNLKIRKEVSLETTTLDNFGKESNLNTVDFIKMDIEGAEYDVISGGKKTFDKAMGVSLEVEFTQTHIGQKTFADVDKLLNFLGFKLYDISIYRHARKSLPELNPKKVGSPTSFGQVIWGQALYFRDPLSSGEYKWTQQRLLKIACLFNLFNLNDCAAEVIETTKVTNSEYLLDLLVPEKMSYREYLKKVRTASKLGYVGNYGYFKKSSLVLARKFIPLKTRKFIANLFLQ